MHLIMFKGFLFSFFFLAACGRWDLSSLTRNWTWATAVKALSPNHWTARKFPGIFFFFTYQYGVLWFMGLQRVGHDWATDLIWSINKGVLIKAMSPHASTLVWKIPWTEEPGRLQSMGSLRVGHDWATSLSLFTFMHWRRKWQPTPVFLPENFHGKRSLKGYGP